jgi:mRNA interferase HigB
MHIIAKPRLRKFWLKHANAEVPLLAWYRIVSKTDYESFNELKLSFPTADYVPPRYTVFNIGGNKYRLVTCIQYSSSRVYIREVFTHAQYNTWKPPK